MKKSFYVDAKRIVCIGGGTGTFVALSGLKQYFLKISAIVTMSDSGGSNKRIRDEFGLLPTSDIRQCLVALSDEKNGAGLLRKLFMYRFDKGEGISGMTFGNLFMAALSDILGSQKEAIKQTGKVLRIKGQVIPVSYTDTNLYAQYEDGHILTEEHLIDEPPHDGRMHITKVYLQPHATANPDALTAIANADLIVLGPGDLYTSLIPNLLVDGIKQALQSTKARIVYVVNLMTKYGQTYGFTASDHLNIVQNHIGNQCDFVLVNNGPIDQTALSAYKKLHETLVVDDIPASGTYRIVRKDVAAGNRMVHKPQGDALVRSLIRHDSDKLARCLVELLESAQ